MLKVYRLPDGFYVDNTQPEDLEIWLEQIEFKPLEIWWRHLIYCHPWKVEIDFLERYEPLSNFNYQFLDQVPYFWASHYG